MSLIVPYPKIPAYDRNTPNKPCVAFEKYDGTNLAWHYRRKQGLIEAKTRRRNFDRKDPDFGVAYTLFEKNIPVIEKTLQTSFKEVMDFVFYTEFLGENSFAGLHQPQDAKRLVFIDLCIYKGTSGAFISPNELIFTFKDLPLPKIIYRGKINGRFVDEVRKGIYHINEGIVCRGGTTGNTWSCKIKTNAWLEKLKNSFGSKSWVAPDEIDRTVEEEIKDQGEQK